MLYRSITERIEQFFKKEKKAALMVTGARQVGKTYCIREYAKQHFKYVIEINFLEMPQAVALFERFHFCRRNDNGMHIPWIFLNFARQTVYRKRFWTN